MARGRGIWRTAAAWCAMAAAQAGYARAGDTTRPDTPTATICPQIIVDQIGWRPNDRKVVLFADPIVGQNKTNPYTPGPKFEICRATDDQPVFSGPVIPWKDGVTDDMSGDKVWTGDFSSLSAAGEYYVLDPATNQRSYGFRIAPGVYDNVLKAATRMFYYQRTGTAIPERFGGHWTHPIDHVGRGQDRQATLWQKGSPVPGSPARDLSGGWFDAGDYNKYVPFTASVLWNLLSAYDWNPAAFGDDNNIPESRNGVPDELDEIKWELDWLLKMQNPDGSVLNRVANSTYAAGDHDPATDTQPRYYTAPTTWATASFVASTAQAARVFAPFNSAYPGYPARLRRSAEKAWQYLQSIGQMTPADGTDGGSGLSAAGADADAGLDLRLRILAAAELFRATGNPSAKAFFEANYKNPTASAQGAQPLLGSWPHFEADSANELNRAYVTYALSPGTDPSIVAQITKSLRTTADDVILSDSDKQLDPYRAYMFPGHYCWGSNENKSEWANLLLYAIQLKINPANDDKYRAVAEDYLHYMLGRNPMSEVYLTNMGPRGANCGASRSVMSLFHSWFGHGSVLYDGPASKFGPPPGYVPGGPNQFYPSAKDAKPLSPPHGEPPMKAYLDFSDSWPVDSWEVTEPAIYDQAPFVLLISQFSAPARRD